MRYFELTQDRQLRNLIAIEGFENCPDIVMDREQADSFKRCTNMYVKGDETSQYPDLFKSPVLMISEKLYQTLKYYDTSVIYKIVVLTDLEHRRQEIYRLMMPIIIDMRNTGSAELDRQLHGGRRIFYVRGCPNESCRQYDGHPAWQNHHLIVTEEVAESILSLGSIGICYEETTPEKWAALKGENADG